MTRNVVQRDEEEWRRPWPEPADRVPTGVAFVNEGAAADGAPAASVPTVEILPSAPQPPPASWGAADDGPGSPVGSVRPPDTTGTVDAPAGRSRRGLAVVPIALAGLLGGAVGAGATVAIVKASPAGITSPVVTAPVVEGGDETGRTIVAAVAQAVTPSVVRIDVLGGDAPVGVGSGVVYRSDGYILTNNHVVEGAQAVEVTFADGDVAEAAVIGTDPLNDLAVVRVSRVGLPAVTIRSEPPVQVGETAIAIGSPFGLDASVTAGVVSGLNRELAVPADETGRGGVFIPAVLQTDAAINPGNSGGALVDATGRLMGINTAILSETGGNQGVGFAIPVGSAVTTADQLIEQGFVRHPFLGIGGRDLTREVAERLGLDAPRGAVVEQVVPDSGAADAGLRVGDVLVALDGDPVRDMTDLITRIRAYEPGDTIEVTYLRDGARRTASVTLGERPR